MNAYVYAPKDDPRHRAEWRAGYSDIDRAALRAVARTARSVGVEAGFAISPGLDLDAGDPSDRAILLSRVRDATELGFGWIVLAFDDIPLTARSARDQTIVANEVAAEFGTPVTVVPTEYVGTVPSAYLAELSSGLDPDIGLMWTGPTVCSPRIDAAAVSGWAAAVGGRSTILWDNTPVNDGSMSGSLHLGPYEGRAPELGDVLDGILLNPMTQPQLSRIAIAAAAEFCADPAAYDPVAAWLRAVERVDDDRGVLAPLARACGSGPLTPPSRLAIAAMVDDLTAGSAGARGEVRAELEATRASVHELRRLAASGDALACEAEPWCDALDREVAAGLAALTLLERVEQPTPDAEQLLVAAFALGWAWTAAREDGRRRVFGGRDTLHPGVVRLADGRPAFDPSISLRLAATPIDRLCRFAMDRYADTTGLDRMEVSA